MTLDGVDQRDYLEGKSEKSARDTFFCYTGSQSSAVRYKNWKFYFTMVGDCATCGLFGATTYHWTQLQNILRDPFETTVGADSKSLLGYGGALARAQYRLPLQMEHPADQTATVAEGTRVLRGIPADAGSGALQSQPGSGRGQEAIHYTIVERGSPQRCRPV